MHTTLVTLSYQGIHDSTHHLMDRVPTHHWNQALARIESGLTLPQLLADASVGALAREAAVQNLVHDEPHEE